MKRCNSDHLVRCYDTYENAEYIILALEYCNAGDLYRELKKRKRIPEEEAVRILKQLIAGFAVPLIYYAGAAQAQCHPSRP